MSGPTLRGIFNRVDTNRDGSLERAEVKKFVEDAGVDSGLFGGKKVSGATDAFVDTFDGDKNGNVSWQEFQAKGQSLIPGAAKDATPAQVLSKELAELGVVLDQGKRSGEHRTAKR